MIETYLSYLPSTKYYFDATKVLDFLNENKTNNDELPDMIFVDINMGIMSGVVFLHKYNKLRHRLVKKIDVYIMSSSIDPTDLALSKKYDFVLDYIIKPLNKVTLKKILEPQ
ncbi:Response regulator receiver domain-containing protein [Mucilaginibacter gossypiicola]|uniref:Response regulator receiver domain-containing protein n=2 Tax=Mucilaginibacter gossypiicola TaxID=551995 RepID=A0A1H8G620_9SPHI|nr:Response regulator receiver domain-containing protein [Mucilaginibacter gossypiicola]